jgi:hypothetical protein
MANPRQVVTFFDKDNVKKRLSCGDLQDQAKKTGGRENGGFDEAFCKTELVNAAWEKCGCYNKLGQLLADVYAETVPPAATPSPINEIGTCSCVLFLRLQHLVYA